MADQDEQTTGNVVPDPGGYLAVSLFVVVLVLIGSFALALIVSAT